jgi:predicted ATPase
VKLIVGAEAQPDELFADGGDAKTAAAEFARTASRLTEMQSVHYLQLERAKR